MMLSMRVVNKLCLVAWDLTRCSSLPLFHRGRYAGGAAANGVLRCGWAVYVSPHQTAVAQHSILLLAAAELVRRSLWAVLRVEWEAAKALRVVGSRPTPLRRSQTAMEEEALL